MNHYKRLGVELYDTESTIRTKYYRLAKQYHPDKCNGDKHKCEEFKLISEVIFFIIISNLIYAIAGFFTLFGFRSKVERILYRRSR